MGLVEMTWRTRALPGVLILVALLFTPRLAYAEEQQASSGGGAAASDPTAAVNFQDIKLRYFDLTGDNEEYVLEAEGAVIFSPAFKVVHKILGARTDKSGDWETDLRQLTLKPIFLHPIKPFGIKAKFALGGEWLKDLGDVDDGTGTGSDQIAPLIGIGWLPTDRDFIITLLQYFYSYDEDSGVDEVRQTGPRLIYIRSIPSIKGWAKADLKASIDHEDDNDFTQTLELQLGTMVTEGLGLYGEVFVGDSVLDTDAYDMGVGIGLRILY
jgi:hypothetical protein